MKVEASRAPRLINLPVDLQYPRHIGAIKKGALLFTVSRSRRTSLGRHRHGNEILRNRSAAPAGQGANLRTLASRPFQGNVIPGRRRWWRRWRQVPVRSRAERNMNETFRSFSLARRQRSPLAVAEQRNDGDATRDRSGETETETETETERERERGVSR